MWLIAGVTKSQQSWAGALPGPEGRLEVPTCKTPEKTSVLEERNHSRHCLVQGMVNSVNESGHVGSLHFTSLSLLTAEVEQPSNPSSSQHHEGLPMSSCLQIGG